MAEIKQGDIVQLKSGGPKMTVERINTGPTWDDPNDAPVECQWFAGHKLEFGSFPFASLKLVTEEESIEK